MFPVDLQFIANKLYVERGTDLTHDDFSRISMAESLEVYRRCGLAGCTLDEVTLVWNKPIND